ncbi:pyruvate dehydrogenase E2 component (dihydrolipoamide acetyltransferase) [Dyella jiangningensis]|uniref:dihydrolipoyllysine-residue acetyltransferase n=1 Tax=Dyella sp. AtDHG13 TaxID=1938897 RepID=UPI00088F5EB8|nr:dihydrolipoyllysine-residue acetyltransferase [Dyella sp. AtDHG13]PXV59545.1 pyruvate dehydrogenase E2 component (dihydrolipoamide acetyltransferase) [Dyella sp. AtDHG13]SDJ13812.1 pyruvate dehydrogenase E2 component (dihydrolipoamide acetyltransferase) [Dyella jiangningensis]
MADLKEARVPDIGSENVPVIEVLVKPGDKVAKEQGLVTLESDKATMEVPAPFAGTVKELKLKVGDEVSEGTLIAIIEADGEAAAPAPKQAAAPAKAEAPAKAAPAPAPAPAPAAAPAAGGGGVQEVKVPDIGSENVPVIEILVKVGDTIAKDQGLITLESDKATMEVPAPFAGVVKELKVKLGDELSEGSVIALVEAAGGAPAAAPAPAPAAAKVETPKVDEKPEPIGGRSVLPGNAPEGDVAPTARPPFDSKIVMPGDAPYASPAIRAFARELGVDIRQVKGSGRGGRIQREDVTGYVKHALASGARPAGAPVAAGGGLNLLPWPKVDFSKFGEIEEKPLSRIQKISGANLARNWAMIPHVTQHEDADITELEAFRKKLGEENKDLKITPLVFQIKAVVAALKKFPQFNASLDETGEKLILKKYFHIGIAVDTPDGLVVPVIRDCDKKGLLDLAIELGEISKKARDKKLGPSEMSGGCFSISSLGGIGGTAFTPIVNAPEVAILGVSKAATKPVWNGKEFAPRLMLPLSLSYDHRVIDGALAARFASYLAQQLGDIRRLLL